MSLPASRAVLRQPRLLLRRPFQRNASTTETAKEKASQATSKASEGLSRVTSSAGNMAGKASEYAGATINKLGALGGRTGRLIGFVQSLVPPTLYYSRVGLELGKIIFQGRGMSPPSSAQIQKYLDPVRNAVLHPASMFTKATTETSTLQPATILQRVRNMSYADMAGAGVIAAEVLGFWTVGKMVGRFKIVGYRGDTHHEEH